MNDIERAIKILKYYESQDYFFKKDMPALNAFKMAIEALEKQIPKKPIRKDWSISKCPACNVYLGEWLEDGYHADWERLKICDCGQKLDWTEVE